MTANTGEPRTSAPPTPQRRIPPDTLSNRLLLARKLAGMTIDQAAVAAGVKPSSWANWEAGRRPQRETDIIGVIADALDIDFNWLLLGGPLTGPRGVPVTREVPVRVEEDRQDYSQRTERPTSVGPKGRGDHTHPMSGLGSGRRPVRVGTNRAAVAGHHG